MDVSLVLPRSLRSTFLTIIGLLGVFALACNSGPQTVNISVDEPSCVDGAQSMTFTIQSSNSIFLPVYVMGNPYVLGVPTTTQGTNSIDVVADVDNVPLGGQVQMMFQGAVMMNASISITNVQFYTVPAAQLPHDPACPPANGPVIGTNDLPGIGFHLEVSNPTPEPIIIQSLEMAESPVVYPPAEVCYGCASESAPWVSVSPGGIVLAPGSPPLVFDLPDAMAPSTIATLLRYTAVYAGGVHRAVVEGDLLGGTVATQPTTWGKVKSLYR